MIIMARILTYLITIAAGALIALFGVEGGDFIVENWPPLVFAIIGSIGANVFIPQVRK